MSQVAKSIEQKKFEQRNPEKTALWFYLLNHGMAEAREKLNTDSPLGEWDPIVSEYYKSGSEIAVRVFRYLLLICTRESRHILKNGYWINGLGSDYSWAKAWLDSMPSDSHGAVNYFLQNSYDVQLGDYVDMLYDVFNKGSWHSSYGGKKWGACAFPLREFVHGRITAEQLCDVAFTLAHNGGPIFNKGMLFSMYNGKDLIKILDVQRAGMIPHLVKSGDFSVSSEQKDYVELLEKLRGESFEYVNWFLVEHLGSKHKYPNEKQAQVQKYGEPPEMAVAKAALKSPGLGNYLEIMPGVHVPTFEVKR